MTPALFSTANRRIGSLAVLIFVADQLTKLAVLRWLGPSEERQVVDGFFKFVHWQNTGAAFSMFRQNNGVLASISQVAVVALWVFRRHFEADRPLGQVALGFLFGGITGNLLDRLLPSRQHVIDFLYFHLHPRGGGEIGFPAFNVADMAITTGVGLLMLLSLRAEPGRSANAGASAESR
jgi:signal peptidase II